MTPSERIFPVKGSSQYVTGSMSRGGVPPGTPPLLHIAPNVFQLLPVLCVYEHFYNGVLIHIYGDMSYCNFDLTSPDDYATAKSIDAQ